MPAIALAFVVTFVFTGEVLAQFPGGGMGGNRGGRSGGPYTLIAGSEGISDAIDSKVTNGKRYYYVVKAVNAQGLVSAASAEVTAVPVPRRSLRRIRRGLRLSAWLQHKAFRKTMTGRDQPYWCRVRAGHCRGSGSARLRPLGPLLTPPG